MNRFVVRKRKCNTTSFGLTESNTIVDKNYTKANSCRGMSVDKQATVV